MFNLEENQHIPWFEKPSANNFIKQLDIPNKILPNIKEVIENGYTVFDLSVDFSLINNINLQSIKYNDLKDMLTQVSGGMKKKLLSAKEAIDLGVEKVVIASILKEDPLKSALKGNNCSVIIK